MYLCWSRGNVARPTPNLVARKLLQRRCHVLDRGCTVCCPDRPLRMSRDVIGRAFSDPARSARALKVWRQACIEAFKMPSKASSAVGLFADRLFRDARLVLGSRPASAAHEILRFLQRNGAIVVGIHGPEDTLLSRLKLLQ
jgi:hypothetical protein